MPLHGASGCGGDGVHRGVFMWLHPDRLPLLLPIGLLGLVLVVSYTPWITRHPLLCLVAPGLGFGPVMVLGTLVALTGACPGQPWR